MNCNTFRFLIQQSCDMELPVEDEELLLAHLESCESCTRFQHQLGQVVEAAEELSLPEEVLPSNLESLARTIMQQLPAPKQSIFATIGAFLSSKKAKQPKEPKESKKVLAEQASKFPHIARKSPESQSLRKGQKPAGAVEMDERQAQSVRLKGMSRSGQVPSDLTQSGTRSLGEKFGLVASQQDAAPDEVPLTLAESIRRKVTEELQVKNIDLAQVEAASSGTTGGEEWSGTSSVVTPTPQSEPVGQQYGNQGLGGFPSDSTGSAWTSTSPQQSPDMTYQADEWGGQSQYPAGGAWEEPQSNAPTGVEWGVPPQPGNWAQPDSAWGQATSDSDSQTNWGKPQEPAGQDAHGAGWGDTGSTPQGGAWEGPTVTPTPASWSEEAEQIQTGMWQAFSPEGALGATSKPVVPSSPVQPAPQASNVQDSQRWDVPIQERTQQSGRPAPCEADRWDVPIQERLKMQAGQAGQTKDVVESSSSQGVPAESIMNRLSNILGEETKSTHSPPQESQAPPDRWDVPIQERMPDRQPVVPASPVPADRWDIPIQERKQLMPPVAPASQAVPAAGGLFKNLDDGAMDRLFSDNLGVVDSTRSVSASQPLGQPPPQVQSASQSIEPVGSSAVAPQTSDFSVAPPTVPTVPGAPTISPVTPKIQVPQSATTSPPVIPAPKQSPDVQELNKGLLQNLDDSAIDKLFSENLGVTESVQPVASAQVPQPAQSAPPSAPITVPSPLPAPFQPQQGGWSETPAPVSPAPSQQPPAPPQPAGGLFSVDDDMMDKLFADNLGVAEKTTPPAPKVNVSEAVQSIKSTAGAPCPPPPKVEGLGRLAQAEKGPEAGSGKIASIGKFLLDQQDLSKLGKLAASDLSDTKMRILTMEASQQLQGLLQTIGAQQGVVGSVIVGHDGILIANSMPADLDGENIGIWALGMYLNTDNVLKKMGHNHIHQVVARTVRGYLIIADFGGGILVTLTDGAETDKLIPLMRSITQLVAQ
ncbi:MAG: hypothetical protein HY711_08470 [Candidatus Melainabacteria bacterium]|nr:hypothetical protein [Candidatus Melainabacteria bacterium]